MRLYESEMIGAWVDTWRDEGGRAGEGWTGDLVGTRENLQCDFALGPSFGMIEVTYLPFTCMWKPNHVEQTGNATLNFLSRLCEMTMDRFRFNEFVDVID